MIKERIYCDICEGEIDLQPSSTYYYEEADQNNVYV